MKKLLILLLAAPALAFTALDGTVWKIKPDAAKITFELPEEGTKGTIAGLDGNFKFDAMEFSNSTLEASVKVNTLNTFIDDKTKHLLSPDFFDSEKYPEITFRSTEIKKADNGFVAVGNLQIKDSVKSVEVPFTFIEENGESVFKGSMTIYAKQFGVIKRTKKEGVDKVVINIEVPVIK